MLASTLKDITIISKLFKISIFSRLAKSVNGRVDPISFKGRQNFFRAQSLPIIYVSQPLEILSHYNCVIRIFFNFTKLDKSVNSVEFQFIFEDRLDSPGAQSLSNMEATIWETGC